jgi:hypothetical protein
VVDGRQQGRHFVTGDDHGTPIVRDVLQNMQQGIGVDRRNVAERLIGQQTGWLTHHSVVLSRALVNFIYGSRRRVASLSIGQIWKPGITTK